MVVVGMRKLVVQLTIEAVLVLGRVTLMLVLEVVVVVVVVVLV